jgi:outer membrane protein OmpA-like peptidoglycan-associated protein
MVGFAYELRLGKFIGLEAAVDAYDLAKGNPPVNPTFAQHGQGFGVDGRLGVRVHPLASLTRLGPWLEASGGIGETGSLARGVFEARLGKDLVHIKSVDWMLSPFVGYTQVFQPSDTLRPQDAHILWVGLSLDLAAHGNPKIRPDRDGDGVYDDEDACPDLKGIRTNDPKTNGCPATDRDKDGILDHEDACPDTPGVRTSDPKTNGCPPDRDHDGVLDSVDACPDVPGVATDDPKTNGCPLPPDRDKDGILDDVDACPDVPGVHTEDPKTNGCPPATDQVHVEGDEILLKDVIHFDTGSPHIHHASYPLVEKLANYFKTTPDIDLVDIQGNADEVGTNEYNDYLSAERAKSVKALLVKYGVDESKLTTHAYGKTRPRDPGHDARARRENRRVEFFITHARSGNTPAQPQAPGAKPNGGP